MSELKKYFWSFGFSLLVFFLLQFTFKGFVSEPNANYILSSITQGLASLIALLFVIIFFLCQSTGRVSMLSQVLKPDGYFLLGIFIVSIIFPLIVMKISPTVILVNISISGAALSIISLFPFIMAVSDKMKEFGIRNIIAELWSLSYRHNKLKYEELLDDLLVVEPKTILNLEPNNTIKSLIIVLSRSINKYLSDFEKRRSLMKMMAELGSLSLKKENKKEHFNYVKGLIARGMSDNCLKPGENLRKLFELYLLGLSNLLENIKLHKEQEKENRLYFAKIIIEPSLLIFNQLENGKNGNLESNFKRLEESMLEFYKKGKIILKDYKKALESLNSTGIQSEIKKNFEELLIEIFKF